MNDRERAERAARAEVSQVPMEESQDDELNQNPQACAGSAQDAEASDSLLRQEYRASDADWAKAIEEAVRLEESAEKYAEYGLFDLEDRSLVICGSERGTTMETPQPRQPDEESSDIEESKLLYSKLRRQIREAPAEAIDRFSALAESPDRKDRHRAACGIHMSVVANREAGLALWNKLLSDSDISVRSTAYEVMLDLYEPEFDDENEGVELSAAEAAALARTYQEAEAVWSLLRRRAANEDTGSADPV